MSMDPNALLMGGGAPSASFLEIGTVHKGRITDLDTQQQHDFDTGRPKFWDDGKPAMQIVVTLATDERDPNQPDDDGLRRIFIKSAMTAAVREAVKKAGARGLGIGGVLAVKYTGDGEPKRKGGLPPKQYKATYEPPAAKTVDLDDEEPF